MIPKALATHCRPGPRPGGIFSQLPYAVVGVCWSPRQDNFLVAESQVLRDGQFLQRVGNGTFYFDAGRGSALDHRYGILAVKRDVNHSAAVEAVQ